MVSDTWPKCPTCRADMWVGHVDAPQRVIHGCSTCNTKTQVSPVVEVIPLFDIEDLEAS